MSRPILIDPADGPCEICSARAEARGKAGKPICHRCGDSFHAFQNMGGNGFQSVKPDHFHLEMVGEASGRRCQWAELCHVCYLAEHKAVYPDAEIPKLPMVLMDLNAGHDTKLFREVVGEIIE